MVFLATVDPSPRPQPMKFPVFSQLAGNLAIQRRVRSRLPPPAGSLLRTRVFRGVRGARSERAGPVAMPKWVIRGGTPRAASAAFRGLVNASGLHVDPGHRTGCQ
jgi:hypothetical protein